MSGWEVGLRMLGLEGVFFILGGDYWRGGWMGWDGEEGRGLGWEDGWVVGGEEGFVI